ncbi:MAG TPA: MarR family transcriptional regulator [Rhizomicrobium sp.]|nr:MarR family transcriptional regulator [Rhizomicrobium sp.]
MTRRARLSSEDYRALAGFRRALRQFLAFSQAAAEAAGLTPAQHQALLAIKGMPGAGDTSVGDLAAWLGIRHHSCVGLVDRLVRQGLVRRRRDPIDRRRMGLRLTARAKRRLEDLSAAHRDELRRLSEALGPLLR